MVAIGLSSTAQLPADVPAFTGRTRELSVLDHLVGDGREDGPPHVGLLTGGPGVGKTGLAVYWSRRVATRFPHGQLFADVLGSSKVWVNGEPASPEDAVTSSDEVAVLPPVSGGSDNPRAVACTGHETDGVVVTSR